MFKSDISISSLAKTQVFRRRIVNIFRRLFNWIQSGPVDFSYVTGEWGFEKGKIGPGPSDNALPEPNIAHLPAKLPPQVAAAAAGNGAIAARVATPVMNGDITVTASAQTTSEALDPMLADLFTPGITPDAQDQNAYTHVQR
jgi:hypothetical protein